MSVIDALVTDLQRPGGGWTFGAVTVLGAFAVSLLGVAGTVPNWVAMPVAVALLFVHALWGMYGYYPRRI